jgi:hypothetical protein
MFAYIAVGDGSVALSLVQITTVGVPTPAAVPSDSPLAALSTLIHSLTLLKIYQHEGRRYAQSL